ncbi:MAG: hypothetical protein ACQEQG_07065 [Bacillota bacterium]
MGNNLVMELHQNLSMLDFFFLKLYNIRVRMFDNCAAYIIIIWEGDLMMALNQRIIDRFIKGFSESTIGEIKYSENEQKSLSYGRIEHEVKLFFSPRCNINRLDLDKFIEETIIPGMQVEVEKRGYEFFATNYDTDEFPECLMDYILRERG